MEENQGGGEKRRVRRGDRLKRNKWEERRGEVVRAEYVRTM